MDVRPLAALEAINNSHVPQKKDEVILLLDLNSTESSLSILRNRELLSTRGMTLTGDYLTKNVSEYCKVKWDEAENLKRTVGFSTDKPDLSTTAFNKSIQVTNAILPLFENMVQNIEHTFKYFSYQITQSKISKFDKIILSGGASLINGIVPFLKNRLGVDVEIVNVLNDFSYVDGNRLPADLCPRLNVALGLALRGV